MKLFLKNICYLAVLIFISCNDANTNNNASAIEKSMESKEAMVINIDGETYKYRAEDLSGKCNFNDTVEVVRSKFRTRLDNEDIRQLTLNFNIWGNDIISAIPQTFDIVNTSHKGIRRIDVNIVDDANTTNRILALLTGTITVHQWTDDQIHFTFEGEAGGILNQQNTIPVSGSVNMKCSK